MRTHCRQWIDYQKFSSVNLRTGISILLCVHHLLVSASRSSLTFTYQLPRQWHHILDHTLLRHLNPSRTTCSKLDRNVTKGLPTSLLPQPGFLRNSKSCRLGPLAQSSHSIVLQVPLQRYPSHYFILCLGSS